VEGRVAEGGREARARGVKKCNNHLQSSWSRPSTISNGYVFFGAQAAGQKQCLKYRLGSLRVDDGIIWVLHAHGVIICIC